jgi:tetratricopeptide (TPR) repeat protein
MPNTLLTVFLSSTGKDLAPFRQALMERLKRSDHIRCDGMENFGARDASPLEFCRERVQACDIFVGLIGYYRGWEPPSDNRKRSITEIEYDCATEAGKPRLMYVAPDDLRVTSPNQKPVEERRQDNFRGRLLQDRIVGKDFGSPDILAGAIAVDLLNHLAQRLAGQLIADRPAQAVPGAALAVAEAVTSAVKAADEGDDRLERALDLLQAKKVREAERLFREVAEGKAARVKKDSREAAAAFRHLGAIAGLADPKRALDAYQRAVQLDPDDLHSLLWIGLIQKDRGDLDDAEKRLRQVAASANDDEQAWYLYWARLGLGDICRARGDFTRTMNEYQEARYVAERVAKADPDNADWQRDLSVAYTKVGDVQVAQGHLPEALKSFRDNLAIAERLAKADPDNAEWQRDLAVSNERIGDLHQQRQDGREAIAAFERALAIYTDLLTKFPDNTYFLVSSTVPLSRLGELRGLAGRAYYERALKILKELDAAARLEPGRKPAIAWIERQLADLP